MDLKEKKEYAKFGLSRQAARSDFGKKANYFKIPIGGL
jgi:hypothetical protein